ncbi:MAG: hydrogenase nickel incorporation protein HypB [Thermogutta sp.]|nr:hydrogenase nickel incorporation protein HypB [Thermogutta sp.]
MKIIAAKKILKANDQLAAENRALFDRAGVFTINILGSPGCGKTTLIEALLRAVRPRLPTAVIEGDLAGTVDADRLAAQQVPVLQINTEGACHLDANMIAAAVRELPLDGVSLLLIENVGNLVCTAGFDLGEHLRLVLLSVPEGDDKLVKYPTIFQSADAVIVTKSDLAPHFDFRLERVREDFRKLGNDGPVFAISARTGQGMDELRAWLAGRLPGPE